MAGDQAPLRFIAAGTVPDDATVTAMLDRVKHDGTLLLVKFDGAWAEVLLRKGLLSKPVTEWGGTSPMDGMETAGGTFRIS